MSKVVNLSTNKYRVEWQSKQHHKGVFKKHSVIVFGEDAAQYIMQTLAKDSPLVDVIPVFSDG